MQSLTCRFWALMSLTIQWAKTTVQVFFFSWVLFVMTPFKVLDMRIWRPKLKENGEILFKASIANSLPKLCFLNLKSWIVKEEHRVIFLVTKMVLHLKSMFWLLMTMLQCLRQHWEYSLHWITKVKLKFENNLHLFFFFFFFHFSYG